MNIDKGTENTYIINRLRNICYVLVKRKVLTIEKKGNTIYFSRIAVPATPPKPIHPQQAVPKTSPFPKPTLPALQLGQKQPTNKP